MYGLLYECKFLTIEETNKKKKKSNGEPCTNQVSDFYMVHRPNRQCNFLGSVGLAETEI